VQRPVLADDIFADVLAREFCRADRFEESFALVLITANDSTHNGWTDVIGAIAPTLSAVDAIGWFQRDAAIGIIRPLERLDPQASAAALAATVQRGLAVGLSAVNPLTWSIRVEIHSTSRNAGAALPPTRTWHQKLHEAIRVLSKRGLDIFGSIALLALLSPVIALIAAAIKLTSKGPVLFRQPRVGQNGRPFTMLKFRTMHVDADASIHRQYVTNFIQSANAAEAAGGQVFKIVDDPRVTRFGHFLRRSSLDELPQFWNVLRGQMSLVGPRPPVPYEVERYKRWHMRRLWEAKPGLTGLWQVKGRSRTTFDEMVRLDLQYAKRHTLWTDIKILLATPGAVLSGKGAH
jgi:exopolysaccharide biosynthesis polyprenyl glycosylphosphotransferase